MLLPCNGQQRGMAVIGRSRADTVSWLHHFGKFSLSDRVCYDSGTVHRPVAPRDCWTYPMPRPRESDLRDHYSRHNTVTWP